MKLHPLAPLGLAAALFTSPALAQDGAMVTVAENETYGQYLADGQGRPLYLFTTDKPEGAAEAQITCTSDACLQAWPLLTTGAEPRAGEGADQSLLGTMQHDGQMIVTYNGWPLYYFAKDAGTSDPKGQEIKSFGGEWYLLTPEGEELETKS